MVDSSTAPPRPASRLARFMPGLPALLGYRCADLPYDLVAGLSVAAVALPVGVAYAQLAGFSPVVRGGLAKLNSAEGGRAAPLGEDRARTDRSNEHEQKTAPQ